MQKLSRKVGGCQHCPFAVLHLLSNAPATCGLSKTLLYLDGAEAVTPDSLLAAFGEGPPPYPAACPLKGSGGALVTLTAHASAGKPGRKPEGQAEGRDIQAEAAHLVASHKHYYGKDFGKHYNKLYWPNGGVAYVARQKNLNLAHFRAALRGARPWHVAELDLVVAHCKERWGYDPAKPVEEQALYPAVPKRPVY